MKDSNALFSMYAMALASLATDEQWPVDLDKKLPTDRNPHKFKTYEIEGYKIDAVNEASARLQYEKIIAKKALKGRP